MDLIGRLKDLDPFLASLIFLGALWIVYALSMSDPRIWCVAVGADGQYSTSNSDQPTPSRQPRHEGRLAVPEVTRGPVHRAVGPAMLTSCRGDRPSRRSAG
jgi:hypothetical protein